MKISRLFACVLALILLAAGFAAFAEESTIILPESLQIVEEEAFFGDTSIEKVIVPEGVKGIGSRAFADSSLTEIELPGSLEIIAKNAFEGCEDLLITAPVGSYAYEWVKEHFSKASPVEDFEYKIEDGRAVITGYTGSDTVVVIPSKIDGFDVGKIGVDAFSFYSSLRSITIPDSVTSIGIYAFSSCSSLRSVTIPNSVTSIGYSAFGNCSSLTSITIPDAITSIEEDVFYNCSSLTSITIPDSITSIREGAFYGCSSLRSITIPDGVTSIERYAFSGCNSLTTIFGIPGSYAAQWAAENGYEFLKWTGSAPDALPTVFDYTLNGASEEITIEEGEKLIFGGTIDAGFAQLVDVQASIFDAENPKIGIAYDWSKSVNADTFDLSEFEPICAGATYTDGVQTLTLEAGKSYIVMLYVTDANGNGFIDYDPNIEGPQCPSILVHVKKSSKEIEWRGHTYRLIDEGMMWTEAKAYCESFGGYLVTITSAEEQQVIAYLLATSGSKNLYWIGLDENLESLWITGEVSDYTNWCPGEPNSSGERYGEIYRDSEWSPAYTWNDSDNNANGSNFHSIGNHGLILECGDIEFGMDDIVISSQKKQEMWEKLTSRGDIENSYLFLSLPNYTFQEMAEGSWMENIYVGAYSQYSQVVDSWFDYSTPSLVYEKLYNYIHSEEYANEAFAQMIVEYIFNFDAGAGYAAATYAERAQAISDVVDGVSNLYTVAEIMQMLEECADGPEACIEDFIAGKLGVGTAAGTLLGMTAELVEQSIHKCEGRVVRMKIEDGIGNINSLPRELQDEVDAILDEWEDQWMLAAKVAGAGIEKLYVTAVDSVIEYALNAAGTTIGFPILGKVLVGLKNGIGQAVDSANIKDIGLGIEYVLISKEMVIHAEAELLQAAREFAANPTDEAYALLINKKDAYRTYAGTAIYWYYAWSVLEADSDISNLLPGGANADTLKADARNTYERDMNKLNNYVDGI